MLAYANDGNNSTVCIAHCFLDSERTIGHKQQGCGCTNQNLT